MKRPKTRVLALVAALALATSWPCLSQNPGDNAGLPSELGTSISIPTPEEGKFDPKSYESSELTGTQPARGSQLIDGRLPRPILDYGMTSLTFSVVSSQRITFFEGGLVALSIDAGGAKLRKRVRIPAAAVDEYLKLLPISTLETVPKASLDLSISNDRGYIRRYRDDGTPVEIEFATSRILPAEIQRFRTVVDDFVRILAEDRGITNPMNNYQPRLGDRLIGEDQKAYKVAAIKDDGQTLELVSLQEPITIYVATKDVHTYFHALLGRSPN